MPESIDQLIIKGNFAKGSSISFMKDTEQKESILLVDDEEDILEFLAYNLRKEGYEVYTAEDGEKALVMASELLPDLIILDIMMPKMDGVQLCQEMRKLPALDNSYIAFLTARNEDYSQIAALDTGGDDYITKPVKPGVLKSRIKAILRRKGKGNIDEASDRIDLGPIVVDREKYEVHIGDQSIPLVKKEFELLYLLATKPGKVFKRSEILDHVWGKDIIVGDRTIDVHVRKIREKMGSDFIKTVKGIGYKLEY